MLLLTVFLLFTRGAGCRRTALWGPDRNVDGVVGLDRDFEFEPREPLARSRGSGGNGVCVALGRYEDRLCEGFSYSYTSIS